MILSVMALALAVQQATPPKLSDPDPRPMRPIDPLEAPAKPVPYTSTPEARQQVAQFGACIADASTAKAAEVLVQDFRTVTYRNGLRQLSDNNASCFKRRGRMRASNLLVAGAIAERLLVRDTAPLGKRLALAASRPAIATYAPSDAAAVCVVRSAPDDVARLFASGIATQDEVVALRGLRALIGRCAGKPVEGSEEGLRAMLATAAFRSVAANGKTG